VVRPFQGKTERRLALVILLTSIVPLASAVLLANSLFKQAAAIWFNPEIGRQLDRGVEIYKDYVKAIKDDMRHQTEAIAAAEALREGAKRGNVELVEAELDALFPRFPELVELSVEDADGVRLASRDRGTPVDPARERSLEVRRTLTDDLSSATLVAVFAVDRKKLDELEEAGSVVHRYHQLEGSREELYEGYLYAFAALLGITMLATSVLGAVLARGVTRRIERLSGAIEKVATGDLSVRVPVTGSDELTELARVFNRMLAEMEQSRARIEYLQRIGAWQEMARRLAHEIKNPLTPIQLAVQECHRKYEGGEPRFRALLDTTLEIVEEEVGTLRRLVGTFSSFARMPHAELAEADLREFVRDCKERLTHLEDEASPLDGDGEAPIVLQNVDVAWRVPTESTPVAIDKQMLRRVIVNLVRNAVQAIRHDRAARIEAGELDANDAAARGHVEVRTEPTHDGIALIVEDDGPGIPEEMRARVFDPYFTTKAEGTGLGLAIVKKVVVEHGGRIEVGPSTTLGGACFAIHLPRVTDAGVRAAGTAASEKDAPPPSRRDGERRSAA
jgi:nitrogen fixation/metabolism regulation signal transduction histidine kinase